MKKLYVIMIIFVVFILVGLIGSSTSLKIPRNFVFVEGGTFKMGWNSGTYDMKPEHSVTLRNFYISKYETTQKEWKMVMGSVPHEKFTNKPPSPFHPFKGDDLPVESVSWFEVIKYCNKRSNMEGLSPCYTINDKIVTCNFNNNGYRLPTEAEWEYSARGGKKSRGYRFSGSNNINEVSWYKKNSEWKTYPIGMKKPNELGLYDMSGNVAEWCWDFHDQDYYKVSTSVNPTGPNSGSDRVVRGGDFQTPWQYAVCTCRSDNFPEFQTNSYGFRCVRTF